MRVKQIAVFFLSLITVSALFSSARAATPEQECQSKKNREVGRYVECLHEAQFLHRIAARRASLRACRTTFAKEWRGIIAEATGAGAVCFDAPLESQDFDRYLRNRTNDIFKLLVNDSETRATAPLLCRRVKSLKAGEYSACRFAAEAALATRQDQERYNTSIKRCEQSFSRSWQQIIAETKRRKAACLDRNRSRRAYQSRIDTYTSKVAAVLAGRDDLESVALTVTGSPLSLVAGGPAQSLQVTNTSGKATLTNIRANFSGTQLAGKVTESGNTCASLAPGATCTLTFTPGAEPVAQTNFNIQGNGTLPATGAIAITSLTSTPTPTASPTPTPTSSPVSLSVSGSPLQLTVGGSSGALTITNLSSTTSAVNISSDFSGTALDGEVTETGNTCGATVPPLASCTLTFTPGGNVVAATSFNIQGSNTSVVSGSIQVISGSTLTAINPSSGSASGGTGVILTGTGLTGATSVTFGGVAATSVNVVNSTTVTAVTPAHAAGAVDVVISTPLGGATLVNGYTYASTAVGQATLGGTIACLNGGLNNLIASSVDLSSAIEWGVVGSSVGAGAQSNSDGASNTAAIVTAFGNNGGMPYAAELCSNYEVDSQGNTPCQAGNTCYNDWFLPAGDNTAGSGQLNCLYSNRVAIGGFGSAIYWSSTEFSGNPIISAWVQDFSSGIEIFSAKNSSLRVRCVRAFTP